MQRFLWDQLSPFCATVNFCWSFWKDLNQVPDDICVLSLDQWHDQSPESSLCFHDTVLALLCLTETHRLLNTNACYCRVRQKTRSNYNPSTALHTGHITRISLSMGLCSKTLNTAFLPRKSISLQPTQGWGRKELQHCPVHENNISPAVQEEQNWGKQWGGESWRRLTI